MDMLAHFWNTRLHDRIAALAPGTILAVREANEGPLRRACRIHRGSRRPVCAVFAIACACRPYARRRSREHRSYPDRTSTRSNSRHNACRASGTPRSKARQPPQESHSPGALAARGIPAVSLPCGAAHCRRWPLRASAISAPTVVHRCCGPNLFGPLGEHTQTDC